MKIQLISDKSTQINRTDLLGGSIVVKVKKASYNKAAKEQKMRIDLEGGHKPFMPCFTMQQVLVGIWGNDISVWAGRSLRLYCDQAEGIALGAGRKSGGVRISQASHLSVTVYIPYTATLGKVKEWKVEPLVDDVNETDVAVAEALSLLSQVATERDLSNVTTRFADLPKEAKQALTAQYNAAQDRLNGGVECMLESLQCRVSANYCETACGEYTVCRMEKYNKKKQQ